MDNKKDAPADPFGVQITSILNKDDGTLPFGYFEPSQDGKLTWNCGYDQEGRITSVFQYDFGTHKDRKIAYLPSMAEANFARDELVKAGWMKMKTPEITVKYADGEERTLTRKQKRYLQRKINKMAKKTNPFDEEDDGEPSEGANKD